MAQKHDFDQCCFAIDRMHNENEIAETFVKLKKTLLCIKHS